ncbi:MAG: hypothetical protein AAF354_07345 [Pseudomonadota bacterium]
MPKQDTYDQQIEALLADDYEGFCELVGADDEYRDKCGIASHRTAWSRTGTFEQSLFSALPGCDKCASEVEFTRPETPTEDRFLRLFDVANNVSLPDLYASIHNRFTRAQLNEFARRQRLARGIEA